MSRTMFTAVLTASALTIATLSSLTCAFATENQSGTDGAVLVKGALLYDNWAKVVGAKPEGNHPLYPADAKKSGGSTWRCKECHGWDYIGAEGRYSKGSHYTGIKGVSGAASLSVAQIVAALSGDNPNHSFAAYLGDAERGALAAFIRQGQVDWTNGIDFTSDTGNADDMVAGKASYVKLCAECHGYDGDTLDFKGKKDGVQGIGWLARDNPQESLHKLRWGHPGSDMPSAVVDGGLDDDATIDLLRYCLTLP